MVCGLQHSVGMTHRPSRRPRILLVGLGRPAMRCVPRGLGRRLDDAGFIVVRTESRAAAMVYGNQLKPDLVIADASSGRVLASCYPDGPFWVRHATAWSDVVLLHDPGASPTLIAKALSALGQSEAA